ncbi:MAG: hypothetical protein J6B94_07985 [Lachnospiraceae bacterium]|nr:hypothetical protein [Lachnospiraceae bacterium]
MKVWKRCVAAVLAFMIFITSADLAEAAGTYDQENFIWTARDAAVVAGYYGLDELETAVLLNPSVDGGAQYTLFTPYDNETEGKNNLVAVDYVNQCIYAKALHTNGFSWMPTEAILSAADEEEVIPLTAEVCYYNEIEYYANGAFTYSGNSYRVNVIYQLNLDISADEQTRILEIPQILAQTAENLEESFKELEQDLAKFVSMIPALYEMLSVEYTEKAASISESKTTEFSDITVENEVLQTEETAIPLFDSEEDQEVIAAIQALYQEYVDNGECLVLYRMQEEYFSNYRGQAVRYALDKGTELQKQSESLLEYTYVLKDSNLSIICNKLKDIDAELYTKIKSIRSVLRGMQGTTLKPGELALLADSSNWRILDQNVQDRIFSDSYTDEDFAALEAAVYRLRNSELEMPAIETETLPAAEISVKCEITYYEAKISIGAEVTSGNVEDVTLKSLEPLETTVKLLAGSTTEEIRKAIEDLGIEKQIISSWNDIDSEYQISTMNYERKESSLPKELKENIEYNVFYTPKKYTLKRNFGEDRNKEVPFGYVLELPKSPEESYSYDYVAELEDGTTMSYSEGSKMVIRQSVTISQTTGAEKAEYRLYDLLTTDIRYGFSDDVKSILLNTAVKSPTLKIRMPDSRKVSEIMFENGTYYIQAESSGAGILGMTWEPVTALVKIDGEEKPLEVPFEEGIARWTRDDFSYVNVRYQLEIKKVEGGVLGDQPLKESEVREALNLPHNLVEETAALNRLLNSSEEFSAKTLYTELSGVKTMMTPTYLNLLKSQVEGEKDTTACIERLMKDEKRGGGWNTSKSELALYSYLEECKNTDWSLAECLKLGLLSEITKQAEIVYECMNVIAYSPKVESLLNNQLFISYKEKFDRVKELLPQLKALADELAKYNGEDSVIRNYVDMEDKAYDELINTLISLEGETSQFEADGIWAVNEIQRNQGDTGCLVIKIKVGNRLPKSENYLYSLEEENTHVLTENDEVAIREIVEHLADTELSKDERVYYECPIKLPVAGDTMKQNAEIFLVYSPKKYVVTIQGVPADEYKEEIQYTGAESYTIKLPAYSEKEDAKCKYIYWITGDRSKVVENGTEGFYTFTKEDLNTLFDELTGQLKIVREEIVLEANVNAEADLSTHKIKGYQESYVDSETTNLYLDVRPEGITVSDFMKLVKFTAKDGFEVKIGEMTPNGAGFLNAEELVRTGSTITCTAVDKNQKTQTTTFQIILLGDVNKSGKLDTNDCWIIAASYSGNMKMPLAERDQVSQYAADVNGNGCCTDSNDVWQILRKLNYWDTEHYTSVLAQ